MARPRPTIRHSPQDLLAIARSCAHEFQKVSVESLIAHNWRVHAIYYSPRFNNRVIIMRQNDDHSIGTAVFPDGSFSKSKTPTVKWEWSRCDRAAEATIPDQYVKDILAKGTQ